MEGKSSFMAHGGVNVGLVVELAQLVFLFEDQMHLVHLTPKLNSLNSNL